jgi:hypothetical protein
MEEKTMRIRRNGKVIISIISCVAVIDMLIGIFLAYVASTTESSSSVLIFCSVLFFAFSFISIFLTFYYSSEFVIISSDSVIVEKNNKVIKILKKNEIKEVALVKSRGFYTGIFIIPCSIDPNLYEIHRSEMLRELMGKDPGIIRVAYSNKNINFFKEYGYIPTRVFDATLLKVYDYINFETNRTE